MFGAVCLLKLRSGHNFVNRAGSAWRLLLLLMLMPWLTRYRRLAQAGGDIDGQVVLDTSFAPISIFDVNAYQRAQQQNDDDDDKSSTITRLEEENRVLKEQLMVLEELKKKPAITGRATSPAKRDPVAHFGYH